MLEIKYLEYNDFIQEKNLVLCLGFFDGLHIAHIKLIEEAKKIANEKGLPLAVFTFSMSVKDYLKHEKHRCLTTIEDKALICEELNVDYLYVMKVSDELIHMPAEEFMVKYLNQCDSVVIGFDFNFGYRGEGDKQVLKNNKTFNTVVIPQITYKDLKVGATRIKANLKDANLAMANYLLGREFSIRGLVISGRGIGRRLGYPTANIDYMPYFLPKSGVYLTKIIFKDKAYYGLTNIGNKPTYYHLPLTVETYVFDLNENLYNHKINIIFLEYIRDEIAFKSEAELSEQIYKDIAHCEAKIKEENHVKI